MKCVPEVQALLAEYRSFGGDVASWKTRQRRPIEPEVVKWLENNYRLQGNRCEYENKHSCGLCDH